MYCENKNVIIKCGEGFTEKKCLGSCWRKIGNEGDISGQFVDEKGWGILSDSSVWLQKRLPDTNIFAPVAPRDQAGNLLPRVHLKPVRVPLVMLKSRDWSRSRPVSTPDCGGLGLRLGLEDLRCLVLVSSFLVSLTSLLLAVCRMYCSRPSDVARRSAQSVQFHLLDSLTRVLAPVVPHLCEEVHQYHPLSLCESLLTSSLS